MKSILAIGLGTALLMSMSQGVMAKPATEKVVRTDRISFNQPVKIEVQPVERVQRTDRISFNKAALDQPSLQPKQRITRTDRVVFSKM